MKLLLADQDRTLLDLSTYALRREGFDVVAAIDGAVALDRWRQEAPDLVLLDLSLPRIPGIEVLRRIREDTSRLSSTRVIVVTDCSGEDDAMRSFAAGADDYVTKPFSHNLLTARVRAVLRRQSSLPEPRNKVQAAGMVLDCQGHDVWREGSELDRVHLAPIEFRILELLAQNVGRVVTSQRLVEYAWGRGEGDASMLKTHVCHLRAKLGLRTQQQGAPAAIVALPTVGYALRTS